MRRRRREKPISNINVVPYLDVLLVLLVIFMITTPLFSQGVIDLPKVGEKALAGAQEVELEVFYEDKANPYRLKDHKEGTETEQLSMPELLEKLKQKKLLSGEDPKIILSAEQVMTYEQVITFLSKLRDEGYDNLHLAVENPGQ